LPYAATSRADKLAALRQALRDKNATHHWIATLDDLAWLLNLRGADVDYNPVFVGHALVSLEAATLFVAVGKVPAEIEARLKLDGVQCRPYDEALSALQALPSDARLLIDPKRITWGLREAVPSAVKVIES
ncbi:MAG: aminopeptidase P family N-terminal domain-containing protein, partial [Pseudomonadota bacterium]